MHRDILPRVIFSPGQLALDLCEGLEKLGAEVTLLTPGPVDTSVRNVTADLSYFEHELAGRGDGYMDLLKKHPFTFITLARQVQSELLARAFAMANNDEFDIVHIYTNEEDTALPFAELCKKPVVFTHHDPFNFLVKYKNLFPKYARLNWISISYAQRAGMPEHTNWVGNIYHGIDEKMFHTNTTPAADYIAYLGRIIEPKGVHLAIEALRKFNQNTGQQLRLKIAGKHYSEHKKDNYWQSRIEPLLGEDVEYVGFINTAREKQDFLGNARALIIPSTFQEPFGMVMIEALACGTPLIGLHSGAISEVIQNKSGILVEKSLAKDGTLDEQQTVAGLADAIKNVSQVSPSDARADFESRFTLDRMCQEHLAAYQKLIK